MTVSFTFLGKLIIIKLCKLFNSFAIAVVIFLEFISKVTILIDHSCQFGLSLLTSSFESVISLLDFVFFLFNFIIKSFNFGFMKVLELVFILSMLSHQVVLDIFIFSFDKVNFMSFLFFKFFEFILAIG